MLTTMHAFETVHAEPATSVEAPGYRVNFWHASVQGAWNLDAFTLIEANDVSEVLRWADEHANGRRVEVFVETDQESIGHFTTPRTAGLVRLLGANPNAGESMPFGRFEPL